VVFFVEWLCEGQALVYQKYSGAYIMSGLYQDHSGKMLKLAVEFMEGRK